MGRHLLSENRSEFLLFNTKRLRSSSWGHLSHSCTSQHWPDPGVAQWLHLWYLSHLISKAAESAVGSTVDSGLGPFPASAWRVAPSVGARCSCSLGCWMVLHLTTPCSSSPSLRQEVGGITLLAPPKPHPPETVGLPHPDPHPSLPTPPCLFVRVPLVYYPLHAMDCCAKEHLVWLRWRRVANPTSSNCRSDMPADGGSLQVPLRSGLFWAAVLFPLSFVSAHTPA